MFRCKEKVQTFCKELLFSIWLFILREIIKQNPQQNLSTEELAALASLSKNKDTVTQKSDKGNSVIIVDQKTYIMRMKNLLSDQRKFESATLKNDAFLNFVVNQGKRIDIIFKNLVDSKCMSKNALV